MRLSSPSLRGNTSRARLPALIMKRTRAPLRVLAANTIAEKIEDTVDDLKVHGTRFIREIFNQKPPPPPKGFVKKKVVILGSGWAAHSIIKIVDTDVYDVTLVSPRNLYVFTPLLPATAVGTIEVRSVSEPIRVANPLVTYVEGRAVGLDPEKRKVSCVCTVPLAAESGAPTEFDLEYDHLIVAVGEVPATFNVPGVSTYAFFMKEPDDSIRIRRRIGECFELAAAPSTPLEEKQRLLSFYIVGGGPTGVEFAATLSDYITNDLKPKYRDLKDLVQVSLLQSGDTILTQFQARLQKRALENFAKSGVQIRLRVKVVSVGPKTLKLADGQELPYGMVLWSAGNSQSPFTQVVMASIPFQRDLATAKPGGRPKTKIGVDAYQRVVGASGIFAVGDCCSIVDDDPLPVTAQVASQQAAFVTRLLNRGFKFGEGGGPAPWRDRYPLGSDSRPDTSQAPVREVAKPFEFFSLGAMAYIGRDRALVDLEGPFEIDVGVSGIIGFLLYQSVYITKQVSMRNRILILFDYFKTAFFGRDLSNL